ncbi:MAG: undecaprenyl-phosphate glucose phosphotransferase [Anaerolineae bacterium]|nr:undecaprenyl-phosphate glucose phosphotransferase [Anaerolineae bacterium]
MASPAPARTAGRKQLAVQRANRRSARVKTAIDLLRAVLDIAMLALAFVLGYWLRPILPIAPPPDEVPEFIRYTPTLFLHITIIVSVFYFTRMYHMPRRYSRIDQARSVLARVTVGAFIVNGVQTILFRNTLFDPVDYPRSMFFYVWGLSVILVVVGREIHRVIHNFARRRGWDADNLLIVGSGRIAHDIIQKVRGQSELGYNIVGIASDIMHANENFGGVPVIGSQNDLPYLIDAYAVEQVIIAAPDAQRDQLVEWVTLSQRGRVDVKVYPDMFAYMAGDLGVDDLDGMPLITVRDIALRGWRLSLKRTMDIIGASIGLIFTSPLLMLTAILIKIESPGPVFYTQERMGLDGNPFEMIKFRSMRLDAEAKGAGWTVKDDPRVTRMGKFMRRTSLDELPQLVNVLMGEMSLVGPRPERPMYVQEFRTRIPRYMERHREKAGMTGWAQVNGLRGDTSIAERTSFDLWYVENWSIWLDITIIIRTIINIILRRDENAY